MHLFNTGNKIGLFCLTGKRGKTLFEGSQVEEE